MYPKLHVSLDVYEQFVDDCVTDRRERYPTRPQSFEAYLMELAGEVGELCNAIKHEVTWKGSEDGLEMPSSLDEASDVLWYLTALVHKMGLSLQDVMNHNVHKLLERYGDFCGVQEE